MAPILVHGTLVPEIDDSVSPMAANMVGSLMMRGLQCPFTWDNMIVFDDEDINCMIDRLPLAVSPWDSIIQKCHVAFLVFKQGNIPKSSQFITECYIPLLEVPGLQTSCVLTKTYRQGLKHVIDATSAFIRLHDAQEDMSRRHLFSFVASIPSVDSMPEKQKAAINAIRCRVSGYPDNKLYARSAIALDSDEAQWHFYLSKVIYDADQLLNHDGMRRGHEPPDMADLLNHNKIALFATKKGPEPFLHMANLILTYGHPMRPQVDKADECIKKALDQFPNSAYVYEQAADIVKKCTPISEYFKTQNFPRIYQYFKEALRLAGKEVLSIRHKMGLLQVLQAQHQIMILEPPEHASLVMEGIKNLETARLLCTETRIHYALAMQGELDFSTLEEYTPVMFGAPTVYYDDDDDDDDDYEEVSSHSGQTPSKGTKKSKKSKKKKKK